MINSAKSYHVHELLSPDTRVSYYIPRYQREYAWGKVQWERFFEDIAENAPGYFLGSIICISQTRDAMTPRLELVDGQQRMATLSLLMAALYAALGEQAKAQALDEDGVVERANLRYCLLSKQSKTQRLALQRQGGNDVDFRVLLGEAGVMDAAEDARSDRRRRLWRGYEFFCKKLQGMDAAALLAFLEKVKDAVLVKIEVGSHAEAYTLFESLNNRGLPLTAVDLLKNKLLAQLGGQDDALDAAAAQWDGLLQGLGEDYAVQERFFRHYYNAHSQALRKQPGREKLPQLVTRTNLMQVYEGLIGKDGQGAQRFLNGLCAAGSHYARLLNPQGNDELAQALAALGHVQGTPSYILLLPLLERQQALDLKDADIAKLVQRLVGFFVRRNLCDLPSTRDLPRIFMDRLDDIDASNAPRGEPLVAQLADNLAKEKGVQSDAAFLARLRGPIYEDNADLTRFILCALAEKGMTRETWQDLWARSTKGKEGYVWSIEHIFPQGKAVPDAWVQMMANGDKERVQALLESHVHKLGNLTLTAYNGNLSNRSFADKRDLKDEKGNPVGYRNGLCLNEDLRDAEGWSAKQIDARTEKLAQQVLKMFPL